jgi:hypothetical protein
MDRRPEDGGQIQRRQAEQHRGQDARPVPSPAVRPRHPQPQGGHDQAARDRHRDDERSPVAELDRGEAVVIPSQVVGLDVADGGQRDDQGHDADGGACVHELDRGSHRRGSRRPLRPGRLAARRVGLVHNDLCKMSAPNSAARCAYRACEHSASAALSSDYAVIAPHAITNLFATPGTICARMYRHGSLSACAPTPWTSASSPPGAVRGRARATVTRRASAGAQPWEYRPLVTVDRRRASYRNNTVR